MNDSKIELKGRCINQFLSKAMKLNAVGWIALILVVVGAVNWGLFALLGLDLVALIFGEMTTLSKIVYVLVALSGVYILFAAMKQPSM